MNYVKINQNTYKLTLIDEDTLDERKKWEPKKDDPMRIYNLLLSRKMEECPDDGDYFIFKSGYRYDYTNINTRGQALGVILFTEDVAEKICEELNKPELNFLI